MPKYTIINKDTVANNKDIYEDIMDSTDFCILIRYG